MSAVVAIERYPHLGAAREGWAIVGIDVIRATTTAVTAVAAGRRCFPVASLEEAVPLAARLENPLLVGELGGNKPYGFHWQNSPVEVARPVELDRPMILLSTSGTALLSTAARHAVTYAACLRNVTAQARALVDRHPRVLLLAGESRGEFREEDRLCCARIARLLMEAGYAPGDAFVEQLIADWGSAPEEAILGSHSADFLTATGQGHDLEFVLSHVDDIETTYLMDGGELRRDRDT